MSLSETNQVAICQILNVPTYDLTAQIAYVSTRLTSAVQTAIEAQITLWNAGAGTKTTKLFPVESNKGVRTDPDAVRHDIRRNIAVLLERPDWARNGSSNYLPRG